MVPDMLFTNAFNIANVRTSSGEFISQEETICVIQTNSGRIYSGVSRFDPTGVYVHAEVEAIRAMQTSGESVITGVLLIGTLSRAPILPCGNCIGFILSLSMENNNTSILMQDRIMNINEAKMQAMPNPQMANQPMPNPMVNIPPPQPQPYGMPPQMQNGYQNPPMNSAYQNNVSTHIANDTYSGDFIRNKVKNLLDMDDEPVKTGVPLEEEKPEEAPAKKGFFSSIFKR